MDQTIRFTTSSDGLRLAYAQSGSGEPIVKAANWLSHLEFDWQSPVWRHWFSFLSSRHTLLRYDARGCGLSDWSAGDLSLDAQVADLESVVAAAGVDRFALLGISQGGCVATEYACRHPRRVSKLVLFGAFPRGWFRAGEKTAQQARSLFGLIEGGWAQENPAFRQVFTSLFIPDATPEQEKWFGDLMRVTSKPAMAARILEAYGEVDIRRRLADVTVPTLVLHCRHDACIPFKLGRELAAGIPGARFIELDSRNHVLLENEPAWPRFCEAVDEFVGGPRTSSHEGRATGTVVLPALTTRERRILELVATGLSNAEIARALFISEKTVRNHLTSIFGKLGVESRARAIVMARNSGLG